MKTKTHENVRKINRQELKTLKAGAAGERICCSYNIFNECCEWVRDIRYCQNIYC
ncbi:hypothetical protein [Chryseobacterium sp.]|uniref:hypothetical protein n=1 Tax=Chryseobacterium sp. TaxID=1871047 RepID=UPI0025C2036A|nr:hypothetical protein [Chryseobacterium sp.]